MVVNPSDTFALTLLDGADLTTRSSFYEGGVLLPLTEHEQSPLSLADVNGPANTIAAVPEPSTLALLSIGVAALARRRMRARKT